LYDLQQHCATYLTLANRDAQDSFMMYSFLRNSIGEKARKKMVTEDSKFRVTNQHIPSGPCFLKVLLMKFGVETNATTFHLRETLHDLPKKMKSFNDNIDDFNQYVSAQVEDLAAGGQTSDDLLVYLFRSYLVVKDTNFNSYIRRKKEEYDEPRNIPFPPEELMDLALTKYLQLKQEGVWKAKTKEEEQITALTAKLKAAQDTLDNLQKAKPNDSSKSSSESSSEGKAKKKKKKGNEDFPAWKTKRPEGGKGALEKNGKTYKWCNHHGYYTASHSTEECNLTNQQKKDRKEKMKKAENDKKLKLAAAAVEEENPFHDK